MTKQAALEQLLKAFHRYYDINVDHPVSPFAAEAVFTTHDEQYFLFKSAKLNEMDSSEYVFFALEEELSGERYDALARQAWDEGKSRMQIKSGHRNSDVILFVITDQLTDEAAEKISHTKRSESYRFGLWGWSNFKVIAYELETGKIAHNRLGGDLKKLVNNIRG